MRIHETGVAGAAVVIPVTVESGKTVSVDAVFWSYSAAPTGGRILIEPTSGSDPFDLHITEAGPGAFQFLCGLNFASDFTLTLAAPGGAVVGKLNVFLSTRTRNVG